LIAIFDFANIIPQLLTYWMLPIKFLLL